MNSGLHEFQFNAATVDIKMTKEQTPKAASLRILIAGLLTEQFASLFYLLFLTRLFQRIVTDWTGGCQEVHPKF